MSLRAATAAGWPARVRRISARVRVWLVRAAPVLWPITYLVFGGAVAFATVDAIRDILLTQGGLGLVPLLAAAVFLGLQLLSLGLVWAILLWQVEPRTVARRRIVVQSFVLGWMGRYLPGVADLAGKYFVCRHGHARAPRVRAAILYEQLLQVSAMLILPALTMGYFFPRLTWVATPLMLIGAGLLVAAVASQRAMGLVLRPVERLLGHNEAPAHAPGARGVLLPGALQLGGGVLGALSLHFVAVGVSDWSANEVGRAIFVYGAATLAGYIVPLLPAGAGAREATIVWLLSPTVGAGPALSVAVVSRALAVVADASMGAATGLWFSAPRVRHWIDESPPVVAVRRSLAVPDRTLLSWHRTAHEWGGRNGETDDDD